MHVITLIRRTSDAGQRITSYRWALRHAAGPIDDRALRLSTPARPLPRYTYYDIRSYVYGVWKLEWPIPIAISIGTLFPLSVKQNWGRELNDLASGSCCPTGLAALVSFEGHAYVCRDTQVSVR